MLKNVQSLAGEDVSRFLQQIQETRICTILGMLWIRGSYSSVRTLDPVRTSSTRILSRENPYAAWWMDIGGEHPGAWPVLTRDLRWKSNTKVSCISGQLIQEGPSP